MRVKLMASAARLEERSAHLEDTPDFGSDIDGFEEEAEETEALGVNLGIEDLMKRRLARVKKALEKLDAGTYGRCERCGTEIDKELLVIDPESELCRACKANT